MINIKLDGIKLSVSEGKTILEIANENGIKIPTLCYNERYIANTSCRVCVVKIAGRNGFVPSCSTIVCEGMEIFTNSDDVLKARKLILELHLSDHFADCEAPCKLSCPNQVDIQGYVNAISKGDYHEAIRIIRERLPMPLSVGRICPAFCEKECRRTLVESPISIRQLKRYVADKELEIGEFPSIDFVKPNNETQLSQKKIAVIGAGPSGLTCGYFLAIKGYQVDIFESESKAGGWLRYGIPEFRLPKKILDKEIEIMSQSGMKIHTEKKLGRDFFLADISSEYDAVYLALGATKAVEMPIKVTYNKSQDTPVDDESRLKDIYLGVDFLKKIALGEKINIGKKVAVIGGGNTAIDCARTAKRLGSDVSIVYRRTRNEMPAEEYEINAAEEEGVNFMMLKNPVEFKGDHRLKHLVLEIIELGDPDSTGRRKPLGTGKHEIHDFDTVITAISQIPDVSFLENPENKVNDQSIPFSRWSTVINDEKTMYTNIANIFAGGDLRRGPSTAIEAVADGLLASENIDIYLSGGEKKNEKFVFNSKKADKLNNIPSSIYKDYEQNKRIEAKEIPIDERKGNFREIETVYMDDQAHQEAKRCLKCSCSVNQTCRLREYASELNIDQNRLIGSMNIHKKDETHSKINKDNNKCIKCGLCISVCRENQRLDVFEYTKRGYYLNITTAFDKNLIDTECNGCGDCAECCPTGALTAENNLD
ncbi:MAG: FAD-dependent oxidoreductase [Candidatus Cloacimonetes bacterium]|nr:FAD-dependent oxidoreductase [Candidatus Cloacimonadota bacterium]